MKAGRQALVSRQSRVLAHSLIGRKKSDGKSSREFHCSEFHCSEFISAPLPYCRIVQGESDYKQRKRVTGGAGGEYQGFQKAFQLRTQDRGNMVGFSYSGQSRVPSRSFVGGVASPAGGSKVVNSQGTRPELRGLSVSYCHSIVGRENAQPFLANLKTPPSSTRTPHRVDFTSSGAR